MAALSHKPNKIWEPSVVYESAAKQIMFSPVSPECPGIARPVVPAILDATLLVVGRHNNTPRRGEGEGEGGGDYGVPRVVSIGAGPRESQQVKPYRRQKTYCRWVRVGTA